MTLKRREQTHATCLAYANAYLDDVDSRFLCEASLGKSLAQLIADSDERVDECCFKILENYVERRRRGEPVAYILGSQGFWKYQFKVTPDTLIPRSETELIVDLVLPTISDQSSVLDLGCGCGAIGLTLALETDAKVTLTDLSIEALAVARTNASELCVPATLIKSNWYQDIQGTFDCIVSNPPYVAATDNHLTEGDLPFEPQLALVGGHDGLLSLRAVVEGAPPFLKSGGCLVVEHGYDQATEVQTLFREATLDNVSTHKDLSGQPRVTMAYKA